MKDAVLKSCALAALCAGLFFNANLKAAEVAPAAPVTASATAAYDPARTEAMIAHALDFLKSQQQTDAGWQMKATEPPAITAIVVKAFAQDAHAAENKAIIDKAITRLLSFQKPDGSVGETLVTYNTAIVISALAQAKESGNKESLDKALAFLRGEQWTDKIEGVANPSRKTDSSDINYGGWDYGNKKGRADNSNLQMALDALHDAGLKNTDPAYQAAITFVSRSQNLSELNKAAAWAGDDGGFIYTPAEGGHSAAGETTGPDGQRRLRSYGAMTYAGLKSMMYAGLSKDDPRVKGAWRWVEANWTVDEHPGMKESNPKNATAGMFYYYHTMARALHAYGEPIIVDSKGVKHDWRLELIAKLQSTQTADGSWVGTQRWLENRPVLATALGVLALQEAQADLKEHPAK